MPLKKSLLLYARLVHLSPQDAAAHAIHAGHRVVGEEGHAIRTGDEALAYAVHHHMSYDGLVVEFTNTIITQELA